MAETNVTLLARKYQRRKLPPWQPIEVIITALLVVGLPVLVGFLFKTLADRLLPSSAINGRYTVRPGDYAWVYPGFLLGWGLLPLVINFVYRIYLRQKYRPSATFDLNFSSRKIDGYRWAKLFFFVCVLLTVAGCFFLFDNYLVFNRQTITLNELTTVKEKTYPLTAIRKIRFVNEWNRKKRKLSATYHAIYFADGYQFSTRNNLLSFRGEIDTVAAFCHLPVDTVVQYY